jgi:CBS domain-containing protein
VPRAHGPSPIEDPTTVRDVMTSKPITVDPRTSILDARQRMRDSGIRQIVTESDFVRAAAGVHSDR